MLISRKDRPSILKSDQSATKPSAASGYLSHELDALSDCVLIEFLLQDG
ncbi:MAG: hypothetical protein RL693_1853 [Verrucomicrobiota bacterium]